MTMNSMKSMIWLISKERLKLWRMVQKNARWVSENGGGSDAFLLEAWKMASYDLMSVSVFFLFLVGS
jgi:hypothetical protein